LSVFDRRTMTCTPSGWVATSAMLRAASSPRRAPRAKPTTIRHRVAEAGQPLDVARVHGAQHDDRDRGSLTHLAAAGLYHHAADRGDPEALWALAELRERVGDWAGAEALYRQFADYGDRGYRGERWLLRTPAKLRDRAGDHAGADSLRRFGLTDDGSAASSLDTPDPG
jgi:hypothetical protein